MSASVVPVTFVREPWAAAVASAFKALYAPIAAPDLIFLAALAAMLFRPPDLKAFPIDRVAFGLLLVTVAGRLVVNRERLHTYAATWPMLALLLLGLRGVMTQAYQAQSWSLLAAKWIVPVVLFHVAGIVFRDDAALRRFEIFLIVALLYLAAVSVFFLFDLQSLIFPRFILDEGIGIHAARARGPFLQAVANGVSLSLLGLLALHSFDRKRLRGLLALVLFAAVPLALLATRTRAVWLGAAVAVALLAMFAPSARLRRSGWMLAGIAVAGLAAFLAHRASSNEFTERIADRSPVDFRLDMYRAGWEMFTEKPLKGWGSEGRIQPEIERRISNFHPEYYLFHNTYLELAVERGVIGLSLYAWLMLCFFRLRKVPETAYTGEHAFLGRSFRKLWPLLLVVYLLNASAVVMNYQFVNGLVFALAGILSAQNASAASYREVKGRS